MPADFVPQLADAAIRSSGLGLVAFAGLWLFRVRCSAARHAAWTAVLAGMLLQIPLGMVVPTVPLKVLPTLPSLIEARVMKPARTPLPARTPVPSSRTRTELASKPVLLIGTLSGVYLAISMLLFVRMVLGSWGLLRILRNARPVSSLGPGVFESALFVVPGSAGWFRARIFLPQAWRDWDAVKLGAVLAHERAHIRRRDWLIRVVAHANVCLFWFHPLAWWLERELARLAEEACDDAALSEIQDRDEYAATLVDMAQAAAADGGVLNWRVISMAKDSSVIRRVNRILNRELPAPSPPGRLAWVTLFACSLPVICLSAAVKLTRANRESALREHAAVPARVSLLPEQTSSTSLSMQPAPNPPLRRREDPSITMCILIDNSGSMRHKRAGVKAAALALVKASQPRDEICIVHFNDEAFNDLPYGKDFTSDRKEMEEALRHIDARGGTVLRDTVRTFIEHMKQKARNDRRVLVLITEGDDTSSTVTQEQLLGSFRNSGVRVYCIGLLSEDPGQAGAARHALRQLANASGGLDYYPRDPAEMESISSEIANEVRKQ